MDYKQLYFQLLAQQCDAIDQLETIVVRLKHLHLETEEAYIQMESDDTSSTS